MVVSADMGCNRKHIILGQTTYVNLRNLLLLHRGFYYQKILFVKEGTNKKRIQKILILRLGFLLGKAPFMAFINLSNRTMSGFDWTMKMFLKERCES
jgi:hypothetical protein